MVRPSPPARNRSRSWLVDATFDNNTSTPCELTVLLYFDDSSSIQLFAYDNQNVQAWPHLIPGPIVLQGGEERAISLYAFRPFQRGKPRPKYLVVRTNKGKTAKVPVTLA
jgi:hypothetical protein